ncbi:Pol polyprotein [Elysia marginata]|uniref:Pol polyprotein n=1 Tax=Elysia marginata TaxID=1093978 RepID=A0AAV4JNN4_9GAST|nr:Pol polyprotein [Elysia marginata]
MILSNYKAVKLTEIDLSNAYKRIALDEQSKMCTINTHKGLYQYNRLVFGISSAPRVFQRTLQCSKKDIDNCVCYIDNIYLTGKQTRIIILQTLDIVLTRLETSGFRIRKEKCSFMKPEISFLGYRLKSQGVKPQIDKLLAMQVAHLAHLLAFLGTMTCCGLFVPNLSSELTVLFSLFE